MSLARLIVFLHFCVSYVCVVSNTYEPICLCVPVDGSGSALDPEYELARRLSEAGIRRMSGELSYLNIIIIINS
jgi:hypothetical protein